MLWILFTHAQSTKHILVFRVHAVLLKRRSVPSVTEVRDSLISRIAGVITRAVGDGSRFRLRFFLSFFLEGGVTIVRTEKDRLWTLIIFSRKIFCLQGQILIRQVSRLSSTCVTRNELYMSCRSRWTLHVSVYFKKARVKAIYLLLVLNVSETLCASTFMIHLRPHAVRLFL